jgi:hypothetical protein
MAPKKVFPTADGRPVEHVLPAANPDAARLANPRPPATAPPPEEPQAEEQGAWAWASDELKQKLRVMFRDEARAGEPSTARKFGAGFGAIGLGDKLGLNPHREIEKLRHANDALTDRVGALEARPKRQRHKQKFGGRGVKKDNDYWLDRWERDVIHEVKDEGYARNDAFCEMKERVYSLGSERAAQAINDRYRKENKGENVVSASSLRRRHPPATRTNAQGKVVKVKGAFVSKRWGQWEPHRKDEEVVHSLAEGSTKMECSEENEGGDKPTLPARSRRVGATSPAAQEDEDKRKRSLADGGLETATVQDLAKAAVTNGELFVHEGGRGILHVSQPTNEVEYGQDGAERMSNSFFRSRGYDPHAVHKRIENGRARKAD